MERRLLTATTSTSTSTSSNNTSSSADVAAPPEDPTRNNETTASAAAAAAAAAANAKYRLMSPAKLPISRSTCLTIPPGLSPTSFLESPVLLSNMKVWSLSL